MVRKIYKIHNNTITQSNNPAFDISKDVFLADIHAEDGMLGFEDTTKTISVGILIPTDSFVIVDGEGASPDTLSLIDIGATPDIKENDIIILKEGPDEITIEHDAPGGTAQLFPIRLFGNINRLLGSQHVIWLQRHTDHFQQIISDGTLGNNASLILDVNERTIITVGNSGNANNNVKISNADDGSDPTIAAIGNNDNNVSVRLIPKGFGTFYGNRETWSWPLTDETSAPVVGVVYVTEPSPYDMTIEDVIAGLTIAGTGVGLFTVDVLKENSVNGNIFTTIFATKPTIDAIEFTSTTAGVPPSLSVATWEKGRRLQLKIDTLDTNSVARGVKISLICHAVAK